MHVFFFVSCKPAGLIRPNSLSGLYLSAGSLLQRLLLSWKPDAALHQFRATHAYSGASRTHSPFFSEYGRNSHICHLRDFGSWRTSSDAPTSFFGTGFSAWDIPLVWCVSQKWDMRFFWRTDTSLHGGRRRGVREISRLASMERASPDACLAANSLIPACGPCSVDLSDSPDFGASLFQVLGVKGLQRQSSCANWSFDEGCPKSCFPHRGLHRGHFHVF